MASAASGGDPEDAGRKLIRQLSEIAAAAHEPTPPERILSHEQTAAVERIVADALRRSDKPSDRYHPSRIVDGIARGIGVELVTAGREHRLCELKKSASRLARRLLDLQFEVVQSRLSADNSKDDSGQNTINVIRAAVSRVEDAANLIDQLRADGRGFGVERGVEDSGQSHVDSSPSSVGDAPIVGGGVPGSDAPDAGPGLTPLFAALAAADAELAERDRLRVEVRELRCENAELRVSEAELAREKWALEAEVKRLSKPPAGWGQH